MQRWGLVPLRLIVGAVFLAHGLLKMFGMGFAGTANFFGASGIPFPGLSAAVVMTLEIVGGLAIMFGFFTRWFAIPLAIDMLVAVLLIRIKGGFYAPDGAEFELTLMGACLTLALLGSGGVSVDEAIKQRMADQ
ncbi:MAG TPA: DoxX family protein [Gemmatimonadales bacterium]